MKMKDEELQKIKEIIAEIKLKLQSLEDMIDEKFKEKIYKLGE